MTVSMQLLDRRYAEPRAHHAARSARGGVPLAGFSPTIPSGLSEAARLERSVRSAAVRRMSWVLQRATIPMHVQARNFRFLVLPQQDRVLSSAPDAQGMLDDLLQGASCSTANAQLSQGGIDWSKYCSASNLHALAWQLALCEAPLPRYVAAEEHRMFRLSGWPAQVGRDQAHQRLAALFTRSAATIYQGCRIADVSRARVVAFLSACEASGLRVTCSDRGEVAHSWPREPLLSGMELRRVRGHLRHAEVAEAA